MSKVKNNKIKCPCCKGEVTKSGLSKILSQPVWVWGVTKKLEIDDLMHGSYQWACDGCIDSKSAILGQPTSQLYCDFDPYLAYFDQYKTCKTCGDKFLFSKDEQKYWYEKLRFWVQSTPLNCVNCRKEIRHEKQLNKELSELLRDKESLTVTEMERLSTIYSEINKPEKSKYYSNLITKANRKTATNHHPPE